MSAIGAPFGAGATYSIAVSGTPASVQVNANATTPQQVRICSPSANPTIFLKFGASNVSAANTDMPILPGTVEVFTMGVGVTYASAMCSTSSGTLYITAGYGE